MNNQEIVVKVAGGYFRAVSSQDPEYPGVDVEFVNDNEDFENPPIRARILFEKPIDDMLRVLIWANKEDEDYTNEVIFENENFEKPNISVYK